MNGFRLYLRPWRVSSRSNPFESSMERAQRAAGSVDPNPVIPKFEVTVHRHHRHMAAHAIGLALAAAHFRRRVTPCAMTTEAHGAVICRVVAPQRLMRIVAGNAGQPG